MEAEEVMTRFKRMKRDTEEVVSKVGTLQEMVAKFVEEAAETVDSNRAQGEEYLAGVQKLSDSRGPQSNPLLKTLIQLMDEDLQWFREQQTRLDKLKKHYSEISQLYV